MQSIINLAIGCEGSQAKITVSKADYAIAKEAGLDLGGKPINNGALYEVCAGRLCDEVKKYLADESPEETSEEETKQKKQETNQGKEDNPDDVPDADSLESLSLDPTLITTLNNNGITTVTQLKAVQKFEELEGVGPKTAGKLQALLNPKTE